MSELVKKLAKACAEVGGKLKAELGRYRMRGFSLFKKIPTWDDLTFMPGTLTRFVIEGPKRTNKPKKATA